MYRYTMNLMICLIIIVISGFCNPVVGQTNEALLSRGTTCTSVADNSQNCQKAFDGITTQYEPSNMFEISNTNIKPWLQISFNRAVTLSFIKFYHTFHAVDRNCKDIELQFSDGSNQVLTLINRVQGVGQEDTFVFPTRSNINTLIVICQTVYSSAQRYTAFREIEVYDRPPFVPPPTFLPPTLAPTTTTTPTPTTTSKPPTTILTSPTPTTKTTATTIRTTTTSTPTTKTTATTTRTTTTSTPTTKTTATTTRTTTTSAPTTTPQTTETVATVTEDDTADTVSTTIIVAVSVVAGVLALLVVLLVVVGLLYGRRLLARLQPPPPPHPEPQYVNGGAGIGAQAGSGDSVYDTIDPDEIVTRTDDGQSKYESLSPAGGEVRAAVYDRLDGDYEQVD